MKLDFIEEPELEFGAGRHIDIRFGLMNYGPLDCESPLAPKRIDLAIIGTSETVEGLSRWLEKCKAGVPAKKSSQPNLFPRFPGFGEDTSIASSLTLEPELCRTLNAKKLRYLELLPASPLVTQEAAQLFIEEIADVVEKRAPKVILCAIPLTLLKKLGESAELSDAEQQDDQRRRLDFHHLMKAKSMEFGTPIQLVLPMTYDETKRLPQKLRPFKVKTSQDEATRAWNLHVAVYYKSGGIPWRIPRSAKDLMSCYVGISFYEDLEKKRLLTSVAQVFNERGEGMIVRGGTARIDKVDRQPHLDLQSSNSILRMALEAYRREHHTNPARVVVHKSSDYSDDEQGGFQSAADSLNIETLELLTLRDNDTRLFRTGLYPPLRGTLLALDEKTHVLYTRGSVDFFSTYPGLYAPRTLGIRGCRVESTPRQLAEEILALTKMNWNKTQFDGFEPITLLAARQVGKILKYIPIGEKFQAKYSFYM